MSLGKYLSNCDSLWKELRNNLDDNDIEILDAHIEAISEEGWRKWTEDNHKAVVKFIISTPKQREKVKDVSLFKKLTFASLQRCTGGLQLLLALKGNGIEEPLQMGYRDMLEAASAAHQEIMSQPFLWIPSDLYQWGVFSPLENAEIEFRQAVSKYNK